MTQPPLILGFDTSGPHCAAALLRGDDMVAQMAETMARGQAERLMGLLDDLLQSSGVTWGDVTALAVGTGPGNFTGIRIGVSAARGLALGLGIPAYGVTGFEAGALLAPPGTTVAIPAPRDHVYISDTDGARLVSASDIPNPSPSPTPSDHARAIALHAARLWPTVPAAPAPFYVRAPDAAPARDAPPHVIQ